MTIQNNRIYISFLIISLILMVSSCGEFDKLMKSQDYEQVNSKAKEYYAKGKYSQAASLIEKILPHFRGTTQSEELDYLHAKCYYEMGDYVMAGHYFETFVKTYLTSDHADDADFLMGYCFYKLSPRPELDQTNTYNALNAFALHKTKFPGSKYNKQCDQLSKELQEKLAEKSYLSAKLYYRLEQYKAAIVDIGNSLEDFPDTKFREELMFLRLKSKYLYAINSIRTKQPERYQETVDDYYSFIGEFPKSHYAKEAQKIYNNCNHYLSIK